MTVWIVEGESLTCGARGYKRKRTARDKEGYAGAKPFMARLTKWASVT